MSIPNLIKISPAVLELKHVDTKFHLGTLLESGPMVCFNSIVLDLLYVSVKTKYVCMILWWSLCNTTFLFV
jgi:hypothetical protein